MYVDPNSGGMIFQVLVVLFGVISTILLIFSGRIRLAFAKLRRQMWDRNHPETEVEISEKETPPPGA